MFVWKQPEVTTTLECHGVQIILHTKLDGTINTMLEYQLVNTNTFRNTNTNTNTTAYQTRWHDKEMFEYQLVNSSSF